MSLAPTADPRPVTEPAPAKINLALHVVGRRSDGYHLLESLAVFTAMGDGIAVSSASSDSFSVEGPFAGSVPGDESNLVLKARKLIRDLALDRAMAGSPVALSLAKHLPVSSGVGGGSSDAAASLRALNRLWKLNLPITQLARLAEKLGADVPMCVHARPLMAQGIGGRIEPLPHFPALALVLVNPGVPVATPAVFKALPNKQNPLLPPSPVRPDFDAVRKWLEETRNDLQAPAIELAPPISEALGALTGAGAAFARMSGSGATCFGLFPTKADAQKAAGAIAGGQTSWWVAATETTPSPVPETLS